MIDVDTFKRPIYAGNAIATVRSLDPLKVITVRGTAFEPAATSGGSAPVEVIAANSGNSLCRFVSRTLTESDRPELTAARVVVSGGRGVGSKENFHLLEQLADEDVQANFIAYTDEKIDAAAQDIERFEKENAGDFLVLAEMYRDWYSGVRDRFIQRYNGI